MRFHAFFVSTQVRRPNGHRIVDQRAIPHARREFVVHNIRFVEISPETRHVQILWCTFLALKGGYSPPRSNTNLNFSTRQAR